MSPVVSGHTVEAGVTLAFEDEPADEHSPGARRLTWRPDCHVYAFGPSPEHPHGRVDAPPFLGSTRLTPTEARALAAALMQAARVAPHLARPRAARWPGNLRPKGPEEIRP